MKKFLSVALMLAMSASFTVASAHNIERSRNGITDAVASYRTTNLPAFRTGDQIKFNLTGLTDGSEITVISAKWDASKGNIYTDFSETIQYVNQYTVSGTSKSITYKVRQTESGIYALVFNDGNDNIMKFFYKVGSVNLSVLTNDGENHVDFAAPYIVRKNEDDTYSVGFIAKATINDSYVTFKDLDAKLGFIVKNSEYDEPVSRYFESKDLSDLDDFVKQHNKYETNGRFSVVYGITVKNIDRSDAGSIFTAQADMK